MKSEGIGRRAFIKRGVMAGGACALLGVLPGCSSEPEKVMGTLAALKAQGYLMVRFNGSRAHARYVGDELVVFSQICQHKQCTVRWEEEDHNFQCPCHDGVYTAEGEVVSGPPKAPLRRFRHELRGDTVVVLNQYLDR
ncbi:MAG: ubiquinol-cytochrome c reductase iron-sulfur subunit [Bacteroidia bacterium]